MRHLRLPADPLRLDALLALGCFAAMVIELLTWDDVAGPVGLEILILAALCAPLAWRRRHPVAVVAVVMAVALVKSLLLTPLTDSVAVFGVLLLVAYTPGAYAEGRRATAGLALVSVGLVAGELAHDPSPDLESIVLPVVLSFACWLAGRSVRSRTQLTEVLHEAALRAEEEREAGALLAVAQERRRIAREMHDVVAHSVSVMVVQAGGARRILERDPDRAVEAAAQIERAGRSALVEMRRLLGVLGVEDVDRLAPQPTLDALDGLADRSRAAGLPVDIVVEGERRALPAGIDLAAYRIVQEALTNALRHGRGAPTVVRLGFGADVLEVVVTDAGPGPAPAARLHGEAGAHGLVGMRERVKLFGGVLDAGAAPGGGFEVRARFPLARAEEALPA